MEHAAASGIHGHRAVSVCIQSGGGFFLLLTLSQLAPPTLMPQGKQCLFLFPEHI